MNLEAFLVQWIKSGLIAWAVWLVAAYVYLLAVTKGDPVKYDRFCKNVESEPGFKKLPLKNKLVVVIRTILWPWGLIDRTIDFVREVDRVL